VEGFCRKNLSLHQCLDICRNSDDCYFGYFLKLKNGETYCYPLTEQTSDINQNAVNRYAMDVSGFFFNKMFDADVFYKKKSRYDMDVNNIFFYFLKTQDLYLQEDCTFANRESAVELFMRPQNNDFFYAQDESVIINIPNTNMILTYDMSHNVFKFAIGYNLQLNTFVESNYDNKTIFHVFHIFHRGNTIAIRLTSILSKIPDNKFLNVDDNHRLIVSKEPYFFTMEKANPIPLNKPDISLMNEYYNDFIGQQKPRSRYDICIYIALSLLLLLLIYILL
jgi:hypothetical protein